MDYRYVVRYFTFVISIFLFTATSNAQDGKSLFNANCASCHAVHDKVIGPALKGIEQRRSEEWLIKWIRNSQAVVKSGDDYAVNLFNQYNKLIMPATSLTDDEIKAVLAYVKEEAQNVETAPAPVAAAQKPEEKKTVWPWLLVAAVVILLISNVLGRIQKTLAKAVRQKQGLPEPAPMTKYERNREWVRQNKKLIAVVIIIIVMIGSVKAWYAMMDIGVTTGYTPVQPIAYSHKLHAGQLQISCIYCHSGAERGKTAGIPSANVCMNCHKFVKKGTTTGTTEIAKIYEALDYDPDKDTYGPNQKPIQWVRVHNLPDLAYFNHSQHYVVGKIECQTCHGPVQDSMTVASQYSPLTMGWCIDCHRKTEVKMEGNAYYDDYHKKLKEKYGDESLITVERIGGTECQRCHY